MRAGDKESADEEGQVAIKVLVADDDPPTRILLRAAISQWGYTVVEASNGEEAWDLLQQPDPPRLLIVDWLMPKLDGISLCARIKQDKKLRTYTILLTQVTGTTNIIKGLEAGADEFLSKPFNMAELRSRLSVGARIIKFENVLTEQNKMMSEYSSTIKHLTQALNTDDFQVTEAILSELIKKEIIQKFGGEFSIEKTTDGKLHLSLLLPLAKNKM